MKNNLLGAILLCVLILTGCTSVPVPTPEQNTLLVGKFLVNWNTTNRMKGGNGSYEFGIKFYFQNDRTGKVIYASTQKDGWLLTSKLAGGHYTIPKLVIRQVEANAIYQMTLEGPFLITIEEGKVNNLGTIQIDIGNDGYSHKLVDYDIVRYDFQNDFPDSEWNSYAWMDIYGFQL
jgi:hypothetical protein